MLVDAQQVELVFSPFTLHTNLRQSAFSKCQRSRLLHERQLLFSVQGK
ncbi:MAG: hypothetical protein ACI93L_003038 [Cyclobacteriaceae bacterium]|jgi:hypothetical protein